MRFGVLLRGSLIGIYEPPNVQAEVEILGGELAGLDGETEPGGVDLEEAEGLFFVVRVGALGDLGHVDQGVVDGIVPLGQREGADVARIGRLGVLFGGDGFAAKMGLIERTALGEDTPRAGRFVEDGKAGLAPKAPLRRLGGSREFRCSGLGA